MSLDVACPEAARLILLKEEGIKFVNKEEELGKHIISAQINTNLKEVKNTPLKYFKEIRDFCIKIIQDRRFSISERVYSLGCFIEQIEEEIQNNNNIIKFIDGYDIALVAKLYSEDDLNLLLGNSNMNYMIQIDLFRKILKILRVDKDVESLDLRNIQIKC